MSWALKLAAIPCRVEVLGQVLECRAAVAIFHLAHGVLLRDAAVGVSMNPMSMACSHRDFCGRERAGV